MELQINQNYVNNIFNNLPKNVDQDGGVIIRSNSFLGSCKELKYHSKFLLDLSNRKLNNKLKILHWTYTYFNLECKRQFNLCGQRNFKKHPIHSDQSAITNELMFHNHIYY